MKGICEYHGALLLFLVCSLLVLVSFLVLVSMSVLVTSGIPSVVSVSQMVPQCGHMVSLLPIWFLMVSMVPQSSQMAVL